MATFVSPVGPQLALQRNPLAVERQDLGFALLLTGALTLLALPLHGYHPYAEDGGLYIAGIKRLLDPTLYPHSAAFVLEPMRYSIFAPLVAALTRISHLSLAWILLLLHLATIWGTLIAAWMLAARCSAARTARAGAVVLLACWLTLPVAGTALFHKHNMAAAIKKMRQVAHDHDPALADLKVPKLTSSRDRHSGDSFDFLK